MLDNYLRGAMHEFIRDNDAQRQTMLLSWGRLIVLELLRHDAAKKLLEYHPADPLVAAVLDELSRRSDQALKLSELSKWSGYSPQHLNRVFRRVLGVTPLQHHAKLRVDRAAQLLRDEHRTIAAVAQQLGFEDPYYFSRLFKQQMGMSPALFRQSATDQEFTPAGNR